MRLLQLTTTLTLVGERGETERIAYAGTWIDAGDYLAQLHPAHLAMLTPDRKGA